MTVPKLYRELCDHDFVAHHRAMRAWAIRRARKWFKDQRGVADPGMGGLRYSANHEDAGQEILDLAWQLAPTERAAYVRNGGSADDKTPCKPFPLPTYLYRALWTAALDVRGSLSHRRQEDGEIISHHQITFVRQTDYEGDQYDARRVVRSGEENWIGNDLAAKEGVELHRDDEAPECDPETGEIRGTIQDVDGSPMRLATAYQRIAELLDEATIGWLFAPKEMQTQKGLSDRARRHNVAKAKQRAKRTVDGARLALEYQPRSIPADIACEALKAIRDYVRRSRRKIPQPHKTRAPRHFRYRGPSGALTSYQEPQATHQSGKPAKTGRKIWEKDPEPRAPKPASQNTLPDLAGLGWTKSPYSHQRTEAYEEGRLIRRTERFPIHCHHTVAVTE